MPPLAQPKTEAMADLADRIAGTPPDDLLACAERAEALAGEIEPEQLYPEDWLVFRILNERAEIKNPRMLVGAAVLTDLSALVEQVCESARLKPADLATGALAVVDLEGRWQVSKKTIDRYRRMGLIARRVDRGGGRRGLLFTRRAIESFEQQHPDRLARAKKFSRLTPEQDARIFRRAERYRKRFNMSLNEVAQRLAKRYDRSHEGVRQLLKRHDTARDEPIFGELGPPDGRDRRFIHRAMRRGLEPTAIAAHLKRSKASVLRAGNEHRADLLRALAWTDLDGDAPPPTKALAAESARTGLGSGGVDDLGAFLEDAHARRAPVRIEEDARLRAVRVLRARAHAQIEALGKTTAEAESIDEIETSLRWVSLLKAEILRPHLGLIAATFENRLGCSLDQRPPGQVIELLRAGISAASEAIDAFDPSHAGRLAARIGFAVDRAAIGLVEDEPPAGVRTKSAKKKAVRRIGAGVRFADWTNAIDPWQAWLTPDPRLRGVLDELGQRDRLILGNRFGLLGTPPMTLGEAAGLIETTRMHAARYERQAVREAMLAARLG